MWPALFFLALLLSAPASHAQSGKGRAVAPAKAAKAAPPAAKTAHALDLQVIVVSSPTTTDEIAVAYGTPEPDEQIKQDFAEIARELGSVAPKVKITRDNSRGMAIPAGSAPLPGITNWQTGTINLDPLIKVFRRYGHFRTNFVFIGTYPLKPLGNFNQPPVRVAEQAQGNSLAYEIWVDQSRGVPETVPTVKRSTPGWMLFAGGAAILLIAAASVLLIMHVVHNQRRAAEPVEGNPLDDTRS